MSIAEVVEDEVVLLDEAGSPIGVASKSATHGPDTDLHLAFSCHVVRSDGLVLVTRRALTKQTWPGIWTNSFCGHPRPAETLIAAVRRRADFELGMLIEAPRIELALPVFRYRAVDASGIVENEVCPVYVAQSDDEPQPNPREVAEHRWVEPGDLARAIDAAPWAFSPWLVLQSRELELFRA